jgi:DNA polymerase-3 subunit beta
MKLQVLQEELSKTLNTASRFTSAKVQLPVLANVLIHTEKNKLVISATNLEMSISLSIGAKVSKEGKITVPSRTITDIVSNLSSGQINLESKKESIKVSSANFKSLISGMNTADFPKVPNSIGEKSIQIQKSKFINVLSSVLFAVSADETRPVLTGVLMIIRKDHLTLVATDGFRLSQKKMKIDSKGLFKDQNIIIPKNILNEILRLSNDEEYLRFSYDKSDNQVIFGSDSIVLSSRVIEGKFPDFERIIPKKTKIKVDLDKKELLQAVKLASVFARDSANVIKVTIGTNQIEVNAESKASGNQKTTVDAKIETDGLSKKDEFIVAFNYRFVEDFINTIASEDIRIEMSDPNSPVLFLNPKDVNFLHIIMPVKIQS